MSDHNEELRTCSRCKSTILLKFFERNRKGELFKLCNNCRQRGRVDTATSREKHYNDIKVCEKCGVEVKYNKALGTHQRTWACAKALLPEKATEVDFYKWALENQDHPLSRYNDVIPIAKAHFNT